MSSIISLRGNGVIGISYGEMDLLKSSLKVARDKSVEVSRQVNRARTNIKIDRSSYRAKIAEDELSRIYREASKNQQDLNRVISNVEYAIKSFKRTDEQCAARIRLIGHGYEVENKIDGFLEGVKSLWNSGKEAFFKMSDSVEAWMDRNPLVVNLVCVTGDALILGGTIAGIIASGGTALGSPITWATLADSGNSFIDRAVKIYNNIANGSNEGFNLLETSSKWALGDDLGGIVYDSFENIMMVSSLASLGKGALKIGKKLPGMIKSGGDLIKNGGKIFDKLKDIGKIGLESITSTFSDFKTNITKAGKGIEKSVSQFKNVNKESHFLLDPKGNRIPLNENGEIIKDGKGFYEKFKGMLDGSLKVESKVVETADGRRINAELHIVENEKKAIDSIKFNKIDEGKAVGNIEGAAEAVNRLKNVGDDILDVMESLGGHTLDRHVGKSKEYLIERTKKLKGKGATTYISKETATKSVKEVLSKNSNDIVEWLNNSTDARLTIKTEHSFDVGNGVLKNTDTLAEGLRKTVTVIERTNDNELGFRIITSYPVFN
ncbi:RNase A-like domain-containing protein [Clostridium hydrogeniformans]|uniref:RNase A-like domain-containing protein n=1 Tax=Clostridium hydrogeniformans TaxID=349933 RepID=UPI000B333AC0|nr:RNase A-like domain-containing protein [Clostridium hydrogeniformans]